MLTQVQITTALAICDRMQTGIDNLQTIADAMKVNLDRWKAENEKLIARLREPVKL